MNRKLLILPIMAFLVIASMSYVMAATTLVKPAAGTNQSTTIEVNATTAVPHALNATIYYNASGGAIDQTNSLTTIVNDTGSDTEFYDASVSISSLSDGASYNFSVYVDNGTDQEWATAGNVLTIDNTNPVVSTSVEDSTKYSGQKIVYTTSVSDATSGVQTSACNIEDAYGDNETVSTSATEDMYGSTAKSGTYTLFCSATDYAGNKGTSSSTITVSDGNLIVVEEDTEEEEMLFGLTRKQMVIALLVIIGIAWLLNRR